MEGVRLKYGVLAAVLAIGASIAGIVYFQGNSLSPSSASKQNEIFTSNTLNVRFEIPNGWRIDNESESALPQGVAKPKLLITKADSACVVAYGKIDLGTNVGVEADTYRSMSFADRIYSPLWQWDGHWYAPIDSVPKNFEFSFKGGRLYTEKEIRVASNARTEEFILFTKDGTAVPDDCNTDLNQLLSSSTYHYESTRLNKESKGVLYIQKEFDDVSDDAIDDESVLYGIFTPADTEENYQFIELPKGADWSGKFFVSENRIYFLTTEYSFTDGANHFNSNIGYFDPLSSTLGVVAGTQLSDRYISSMYVYKDKIYYLAGESALSQCIDGYGECRASLYATNRNGGVQTLLAESVLGGAIEGYSESEKALYLSRNTGDAGCISYRFSRFSNNKEESLGSGSACSEAVGENLEMKEVASFRSSIIEKFSNTKTSSPSVRIENGSLSPDSTARGYSYTQFLFDR